MVTLAARDHVRRERECHQRRGAERRSTPPARRRDRPRTRDVPEMWLMWKPVAVCRRGGGLLDHQCERASAGKLDPWRRKVDCLSAWSDGQMIGARSYHRRADPYDRGHLHLQLRHVHLERRPGAAAVDRSSWSRSYGWTQPEAMWRSCCRATLREPTKRGHQRLARAWRIIVQQYFNHVGAEGNGGCILLNATHGLRHDEPIYSELPVHRRASMGLTLTNSCRAEEVAGAGWNHHLEIPTTASPAMPYLTEASRLGCRGPIRTSSAPTPTAGGSHVRQHAHNWSR